MFYPLIYHVQKGPTLSVENLAFFSITEQESGGIRKKALGTYSYEPKILKDEAHLSEHRGVRVLAYTVL